MRRRDFIKMAGSAAASSQASQQSQGSVEEEIASNRRKLSRGRRFLTLFAGASLGFCAMGTIWGLGIDAHHLLLLYHQHAETDGWVIRYIPNSHGLVQIGYSIGGRPYQRAVRRYRAGLSWAVGDTVPVYYYPDDPAIAFTEPAGEIVAVELPAWIGGSLLGSVFGIGVALRIVRVRERGWSALFVY